MPAMQVPISICPWLAPRALRVNRLTSATRSAFAVGHGASRDDGEGTKVGVAVVGRAAWDAVGMGRRVTQHEGEELEQRAACSA